MLKDFSKILFFFVLGIFGGIFGSQILWPYFVERPLLIQYRLEQNPIQVTQRIETKIQENIALQEAIEKVKKTVVGIKTETKKGKILEGSGFILTSDGLVVTLAELVPEGSSSIFLEGEINPFQILKKDSKENLALLKIEKRSLSTTGFSDLEKLRLGQRVFLLGAINLPNGGLVVNEGIVRSFSQDSIETNIFEKNNLLGSPLFDIEGNILGLNEIDKEGRVITIPILKIKSFAGF
jgi:S1-C subfamily serine protease